MVNHLLEQATYTLFQAWLLVVEDWVLANTYTLPDNLEPATVCAMAHLTMNPNVYFWLETYSMLGTI